MPSVQDTMHNYDADSPAQITREQYTNVGSSKFQLNTAAIGFKGGIDFEIWDSASGGTQLTKDVDYELSDIDQEATIRTSTVEANRYNVYTRVKVLNATYQTGDIYITCKAVFSYPDAAYFNNLRDDVTTAIAGSQVLQRYIAGLEISNNSTDSDHDIDIATGVATDGTNAKYLTLSSTFTKQIDATFAKGINQGGLDTGTVANNTFYYFWLIEQDSTNDTDILISASQTSPTMPAGWTAKRRIRGAVLTDGSANIFGFRQKNNSFMYNDRKTDVNITGAIATTRVLVPLSVPPNFVSKINVFYSRSITGYILIQESSETDVAPSATYHDLHIAIDGSKQNIEVYRLVDSNRQIAYRSSLSTISSFVINTLGFEDNAQ